MFWNQVPKHICVIIPHASPAIDDKMFAVISIYGFIIYILSITNHKPEQLLYIIFKYIFSKILFKYITAVNI